MNASFKIIIYLAITAYIGVANASIFSEIPVLSKKIASFFNKTSHDIHPPSNANAILNDSNKLPPVKPTQLDKPINDVAPLNLNAGTIQTGRCVTRKLSADPKITAKEADEFCRRAFYSCVKEYQNSFGFNDAKCLSVINDNKPYPSDGLISNSK